MSILSQFHPAVAGWFEKSFAAPTPPQLSAWPAIQAHRHVLIAAPTGSGKTLAAFLAALDELVQEGCRGPLPAETRIVYVSPLKALSNDIQRNLEVPIAGIRAELAARGLPDVDIQTFVRTGDTPQAERTRRAKNPPHILVTTPESLYILLGSDSGRRMLATTRRVIVDEIHAMVASKRGLHLALSLERLEALTAAAHPGTRLTRIGLSATCRPLDEVARFLVGGDTPEDITQACTLVDTGHVRERDLQIEMPRSPLEAVMSGEVWTEVYDRLAELIAAHRTTLIFVNTRRHAERIARHLSDRLGTEQITAHHGSLAKELRMDAEGRLKRGELKALVATASLELGIDIGEVDLVCQIGSPRAIAALLQRVGRSGHSVGGTPKGRLFPLSRDDLAECAALLDAVRRGELDRLIFPDKPVDVLAQQIVAEVSACEWEEEALFALCTRAHPYRSLTRETFDEVVRMLAEGFSTKRGRRAALLHHDPVNRRLRGRRGARLTALTSGGTIPDTADYQVILEPQSQLVGTVNEDFAIESLQGDIFQLGNVSYRILRVEQGRVRVEDAEGQPPTIPFWLGEAPARSAEVSWSVSRLREELEAHLPDLAAAQNWLIQALSLDPAAAAQLATYLASARAALGALPTQRTLIFERFFDEAGGMQLVIHSPFGSRINRAWGLSLRKRFCRSFNFELQAAATEDAIILSLTTAHSFELADVARYLHSNTVRPLLVQALCAAPMFPVRWRWSAGIALALPRFVGGRKLPAPLARMASEDLLASVFPDQVACAENLSGELEIPEHPLVNQAIHDCLHEAMDIEGFEQVLKGLESGAIRVLACDLTEPSPLALEVLSARPYAFLDDAPLEERRTQAVMSRRWLDPESASDLGKLDPEAIARVRREAWPEARTPDEMHDALQLLTFLTPAEAQTPSWPALLAELVRAGRVTQLPSAGQALWVATERLPMLRALFPQAQETPPVAVPTAYVKDWDPEKALVEVIRGRLECSGPLTVQSLAGALGLPPLRIASALAALQREGVAMKGAFTSTAPAEGEWCERGLLARIHRYTVKRLRAEIEPVSASDFLRFLFTWQHVTPETQMEGPDAVAAILAQLEGYEAAACAWEADLLPSRIREYEPAWLDAQCLAGRFSWTRLAPRRTDPEGHAAPVRATPIVLLARRNSRTWQSLTPAPALEHLSPRALAAATYLRTHGASFFDEIAEGARLLPSQAEEALAELVALGIVNADSFGGLRALLVPASRRTPRRRGRGALFGMDAAGRWALTARPDSEPNEAEALEHIARTLLHRWGVVCWRLLAREASWLPPWRDLLMCYRRLEARGEVRGGRFVAGFSGEQFALPEAVGALREVRKRPLNQSLVCLSGADPLNLVGLLTPGARLPALAGNRVLYRDGLPIALLAGGEVRFLEDLPPAGQWTVQNHLLRRAPAPSPQRRTQEQLHWGG